MTKTKTIITIEHTLKEILHKLSEDDIKSITGKSKSYIYKCADPDDKDRNIHFKHVLDLEKSMLKYHGKTPVSNLLKDYIAVEEKAVSPVQNISHEVMSIGGRMGDLMDSINESTDEKSSGGTKIVPHEKEKIYDEIQKLDEQLVKIKSILKVI